MSGDFYATSILPFAPIADIIGTNPNNIGVRISRIKDRLKRLLDEKDNRSDVA